MATRPDAAGTDLVRMLSATPLFSGLPGSALAAVAEAMRPQTFTAGQSIFSRDQAGDALYLIEAGRVRLSLRTPERRELTLRFVEAGEVMGEIAAIDLGPRTADAVAVGLVRAHTLSAQKLAAVMDHNPAVGRAALGFVCGRLRDTTNQLEEIALYPIERRVARFLISALVLGGHDRSQADITLDLKMNQTELALLLGASRPKVNVALGALSQAGAITRQGDSIVCHMAALSAYAGAE